MRNDPPSGLGLCGLCGRWLHKVGDKIWNVYVIAPNLHTAISYRTLFYWHNASRINHSRLTQILTIAGAEPDHFVGVNKIASVTIHAHFWSRSVRESKNGKWGWQNYRNSGKWGWQKCALLVCNIPVPYRIVVSRYEHSVTV
jgi:hypothetical protein